MNERIKKLLIQSALDTNQDPNGDYNVPMMNRYAKLIIRECIDTIKKNENISLNIGNFMDEKKQGIHLGLEFAICDIQDHFGIKE